MKKILVVLLVLAVAGGVFAQQGEWSLSGKAVVGTRIDLDPNHGVLQADGTEAPATISGVQYEDWDPQYGVLEAAYNLESLKAYVNFKAKAGDGGDGLTGGINYNGENFALGAEAEFFKLLFGGKQNNTGKLDVDDDGNPIVTDLFGYANLNSLWGYFKLLNGIIHLEGAYKHGSEFWTSDKSGAIINMYGWRDVAAQPYGPVNVGAYPWDEKATWGNADGTNYFLTNVELESFNFGIKIPLVYRVSGNELVADVLKNSVVGLKFDVDMFEFAGQFYMRDYGVYFGGKVKAGALTVGLSFMGILNEKDPVTKESTGLKMQFGGKAEFNADAFSVYARAFYGLQNDNQLSTASTVIGIEPGFYFNVIPTHLRFQTDVGFYFDGLKINGEAQTLDDPVTWAVRPQLFWNFLGTGAGGYPDTGMAIRYKLVSGNKNNTLDAAFRWSF